MLGGTKFGRGGWGGGSDGFSVYLFETFLAATLKHFKDLNNYSPQIKNKRSVPQSNVQR